MASVVSLLITLYLHDVALTYTSDDVHAPHIAHVLYKLYHKDIELMIIVALM